MSSTERTERVKIKIREWRAKRGFSISELSRAAGVNRANLSKIEAGKTKLVSLEVLEKLAWALHVRPSELIAP